MPEEILPTPSDPDTSDISRKYSVASGDALLRSSDTLNIASYVPSRVIRYYEKLVDEGKQVPEAGWKSPISSILLVADISGFTALSKYLLESKGKDGPDLTSQYLNQYFHRMMCIIQEYGGDVLKFAGDALLINFDMSKECAKRAVECALVLVAKCDNYSPSDDMPIRLSLHAAIGGGSGVEMHIGGIGGRREHCISGGFFNEVGELVDASNAGQVAISPLIHSLIEDFDYFEVTPLALRLSRPATPARLGRTVRHTISRRPSLAAPLSSRDLTVNPDSATSRNASGDDLTISLESALSESDDESASAYLVAFNDPSHIDSISVTYQSHRFRDLMVNAPTTTTYLDAEVQKHLMKYVQPFVRGALECGSADHMAEMRHVSTIFCYLPSFEEVGLTVYQQVLTALQLLLSIHDGMALLSCRAGVGAAGMSRFFYFFSIARCVTAVYNRRQGNSHDSVLRTPGYFVSSSIASSFDDGVYSFAVAEPNCKAVYNSC